MQVVRALAVAAAVALVAGCAVGSSSTSADDARALSDPVAQATSAVATVQVAVRLLGDDRVTAPVADAALVDQIHVLEGSADAVSTLVPAGPDGSGWQQDALGAVRDAQAAVVSARGWVNKAGGSQARVSAELDASAEKLDALTTTLERAGGS
jgi:hypothetical protein